MLLGRRSIRTSRASSSSISAGACTKAFGSVRIPRSQTCAAFAATSWLRLASDNSILSLGGDCADVRRIGDDPLPLLEYLGRDDDFRGLEQPAPPKPRQPTRYEVEPYDPADEQPDEDEAELGHLTFEPGGAT